MKRLFNYQNGEINLILNEPPLLRDYPDSLREEQFSRPACPISNTYMIGLELKVHTGGRMCYGLLAAQAEPCERRDSVMISVAYTPGNTVRYKNSLLTDDRYIYKGLPEEYMEFVMNRIRLAITEQERCPQCRISFLYAANCEVGSSPMLFGIIAEIIIKIICTGSINELPGMDQEAFTERYIKQYHLLR